jgi:nitrogen fixation protein NifZ
MTEQRYPRFDWGLPILAAADIHNDGSYPEQAPDALLVTKGSPGEIVRVGHHEESNAPLYLVEFQNGMVVGCFEEEITPLRERRP